MKFQYFFYFVKLIKFMKNDFQQKQKSVMTSLTGTSIHQMMSLRNSISFKEKGNKNFSEKSFQRHLPSGVRQTEASSRQKIDSRRYETLTAGQQFKKRDYKKSKSFSNNIYFPHKNFAKINKANEQKATRNIIRLKNKSQGRINKLHTSLNTIPKDNHDQKDSIAVHTTQTETKQEVSFLTRLNLEKRNKIMEIYRPVVPKEFAQPRKLKAQTMENTDSLKSQHYTVQGNGRLKTDSFQKQMFPIKQKRHTEKPSSSSSKTKSQPKLQQSQFRPSLITHMIIVHPIKKPLKTFTTTSQEKSQISLINKKLATQIDETKQKDQSQRRKIDEKRQKNQSQRRKIQKETSTFASNNQSQQSKVQSVQRYEAVKQKLTLPKYSDFYDNYVTSAGLKNHNISFSQLNKNCQISQQVQRLISNCYTPVITDLKLKSVTPRNIQQPCQNSGKELQQDLCSTNDDSLNGIHLQKLKAQLLQSDRYTPKLRFMNKFLAEQSNFNKDNFKILKINQGTYFGQVDDKTLPHGIGLIFYKTAKLFEGYFAHGLKDGQGLEIYPDGSFFLGNYLNNQKNGKGRFQWSNGEIYDGEWLNDKKHGSGQWKADNAISYVGEWKSNKIQGFGVLIQASQRYQGEFINFAKHGHGTYRYENGQVYTGGFRNNRLNGEGEYFWPNADHYKGDFLNNKRHGKGALHLATQDILYRGQFRNDKKCGFGQETYRQKVQYVGNFENDFKHGWGILKRLPLNEEENDEIIYQGYWVNNQTIQMSNTPVEQFQMIEEDEAEYYKNEASKSNMKKALVPQRKQKNYQKLKQSPYKSKSPSRKAYPILDMKPKQSIGLKGRSRYMRINNHYIQKSIQGSRGNLHERSMEKLERSRSGERGC